jgi:hypothetical protein
MPRAEAVEIVDAIAGALDYADGHGLLHRNVKPANILLSGPGTAHRRILLADMGIARRINDISGLTPDNVGYTASEQLLDLPFDTRADQYSLAATAYHLLSGQAPFAHSSPVVVISRQLGSAPPQIASARPELADLSAALSRALAKDPAARFTRCQDFAAALRRDEQTHPERTPALTPSPTPMPSGPVPAPYGPPWPAPGWGPSPTRRTRRRWAFACAALAVVTVAAVAVAAALVLARPQSGDHPATPTSAAPGGVWASGNDTGPAIIITGEPTCPTWTPIGNAWLDNSLVEGWDATHPGQRNPLTAPGNTWTPAERTAMQATANASRIAAVKTAALARTTPHRVMREYYEQFIAYARGFADVLGDAYVPTTAWAPPPKAHSTRWCRSAPPSTPGRRKRDRRW